MQVPKFSRWVTIPVLVILNFLAWLYIYDEYMMNWVFIYPMFMLLSIGFTAAAEMAFGRDRHFKYVGINICVVLLCLIMAQKYFPLAQVEERLWENHHAHIKVSVADLNLNDKAVRSSDIFMVVRNYQEGSHAGSTLADALEVYKEGRLIEGISLADAIAKIEGVVAPEQRADFITLLYQDVRYVGLKQKPGGISLGFSRNNVSYIYVLEANEQGFIWEQDRYIIRP